MYARAAFAIAIIEAQKNAECGLGYAIVDAEGRFFCGFRQEDGSLAHAGFRQAGGSFSGGHEITGAIDAPVFLSTDDMRAQNISAAVFGMIYQVNVEHQLPKNIEKECRRVLVRKDQTFTPDQMPKPSLLDSAPLSKHGLASADACAEGRVDGYLNLSTAIKAQVNHLTRTARNALTR